MEKPVKTMPFTIHVTKKMMASCDYKGVPGWPGEVRRYDYSGTKTPGNLTIQTTKDVSPPVRRLIMDIDLLSSMFEGLPRQGPGSDESTAQAFSLIPSGARKGAILDIGCGSGMQTMALARLCPPCSIVAIDRYQPFLDDLTNKVTRSGLAGKIKIMRASMDNLPFSEDTFDIIWSEGSAFIMGIIPALTYWKKFLKPDGFLVFSDCTWFTHTPSEDCRNFWNDVDPGMKHEDDIASSIRALGFLIVAHFRLPAEAWWDNFYQPLAGRLDLLREKYADNDEAGIFLTGFEREMDIFRKYSSEYGYTFFILRNPA